MRRGLTRLVCAYLMLWVPLGFANELLSSFPSLEMRGRPAIVELAAHAAAAMLSAAAGYMLLIDAPAARAAATAAILAAACTSIQSIYWTVLPRQLAPGESLPMLAVICLTTVVSLVIVWQGQSGGPSA